MTPLAAALRYGARGWRILPCDAAKHPLTEHGFRDASSDPDDIRRWWRRYPHALIGFWPGPSDIAVLDIDMKHGIDGLATFTALERCPILPPVPTVRTPSGGLHLHYRMPEQPRIGITAGAKGRGIGAGLDWRGDDGCAILPTPGINYRWGAWHFGNCVPLLVPPELVPKAALLPGHAGSGDPPECSVEPLAGALRFLATVTAGSRNSALYWAACCFAEAIGGDLVAVADALGTLVHVGTRIGLVEREVMATIKSAFGGDRYG